MSTVQDLLANNTQYQSLNTDQRQVVRESLQELRQQNLIDLKKQDIDYTCNQAYQEFQRYQRVLLRQIVNRKVVALYQDGQSTSNERS